MTSFSVNPDFARLFVFEAQFTVQLQRPHIVSVLAVL